MKNISVSQLHPISSLPRNYSQLADSVQKGEEVIFLKRSTPYVVLVDFERWQKLLEFEKRADEVKALADLRNSENEYESGRAEVLTSLADL